LWRRLTLPRRIDNWSLTSLQQRVVKTGGRLVKHARYYWLRLAEGHLNRQRFRAMGFTRSVAQQSLLFWEEEISGLAEGHLRSL